MAAILPPIKGNVGGGLTQVRMAPIYSPNPPKGPPSGRLKPLKKPQGKAEREISERRHFLRSQQPDLTKQETSMYRNTYKHNLCLDMLQDGYHMSFCELFALIKQQEEDRQRAGPESLMWTQVMLKDEHEKLDMLKIHLTQAESAERKGDFAQVYSSRFELAKFFQGTGDKWLSDHFFDTCLATSTAVKGDGGKTQAEGHCNMGLALEESGHYFEACQHFEAYLQLASENRDWSKDETVSFYTDACINLYNIYRIIGDQLEDEDPAGSLELLIKAFSMAKESCDKKLEGEAAYRLGLAYEKTGDGVTALLHLNNFLDACREADDNEGVGRACDAIAKAYARQGKVIESIEYLKQFVETAEKSGQEAEYSQACHNLGSIFNSLGRYDEATEYFSKAYNISRAMGETGAIHVNRVQYGISLAHRMMMGFASHVGEGQTQYLERLIEWKSARTDDFDKPLPDPSTPKPVTPVAPPVEESSTSEEKEDEKTEGETTQDQPAEETPKKETTHTTTRTSTTTETTTEATEDE